MLRDRTQIKIRTGGLAKASYATEIAKAVNRQQPLGRMGQVPPPRQSSSDAIPMQITTAADTTGIAGCKPLKTDGTVDSGATEVYVVVLRKTAADEKLLAVSLSSITNITKDSKPVLLIEFVTEHSMRVALRKTGGALGSDGQHPSTWTYSICDPTNTYVRATGVALDDAGGGREEGYWTDPATWGLADFLPDAGGNWTWKLVQVYEKPHQIEDCDPGDTTSGGDGEDTTSGG